ncbi:XRE family transcriptional regulator [Streptomyces sp. AMCC400023]|uniref:XRE family transcriptional regulator n=1 Tax=Streptomyces sp. AMCC400023 TaxID=2056258 RepID=UPI001F2D678D|nr:XRE family transcriptional regulator [Streptomyces sp. AMCC400023]
MIYQPPIALPRELLDEEETQHALRTHDFGTLFQLARARAGFSYSLIATECDIKPERVGTLAKGRGKVTSFEKIVQIVDAFRIPGHMVGLAARPWETDALPVPVSSTENGPSVRRRTVLQAATGGLAATLPTLQAMAAPKCVSIEYVDRLRERTARLRRLDEILGGGDTYRTYLGEYQASKALLRTASFTDDSRRRLMSLVAEQAQQAGWAAFDGGRPAEAKSLYQESKALAQEAGDGDLLGNSLAFLAYQTADPGEAVAIAARSCAAITDGTPSGVRALLHERMAWAYAVADQQQGAERSLDDARTALADQDADEPQPDWVSWVDSTELAIMTGRCWAELRRPLRAVPVLETALSRFDDTHARDKSLYLTWLADAYYAAGEIEEAANVVGRALDLSTGVASVRPRQRLATVLAELSQHRNVGAVRSVLEKVAS